MKYAGLMSFLAAQQKPRISLTFAEIVRRAGVQLPRSAYEHPAWWANDPKSHVQARAWLDAGYKTENLDLSAQRVEFVRTKATRAMRVTPDAFEPRPSAAVDVHPAYGALKGSFAISVDWDVTKSALEEGELEAWEASIDRKFERAAEGLRRKV